MGKVTLQDVAKAAGVSIATASWAVNDNKNVRIPEATRRKVRKVADRLGYHSNALARGLARGRSDLIGFVSDGVATSPFAGQVIQGAQDEAWRNGKILLVVDTDGNPTIERKAFAFMLEHQVEGVIYSSWVHRSIVPPAELDRITSVLVNCFDEQGRFPAVVPNELQGGRTATQLLIDAGHRRIAFVNDPPISPASVGRLAGYRQALEESGIEYDPRLVIAAGADQEGGYGAAGAVLASGATAVFCYNDRASMGLYDTLRERGLRVPDDLSVVGFDNQEVISAHLHPALTTVGLPQYDLGVLGVRALLALQEPGADRVGDDAAAGMPDTVGMPGVAEPAGPPYAPLLVACPTVTRDSIKPR